MKTLLPAFVAIVPLLSPLWAADSAKVTLVAKARVVTSDHDLRGKFGSTAQKTVTLKVTVANVSGTPLAASELAGDALVKRERDGKEKIVKETLGKTAVPALKPNEKVELELGKITLTELERGKQKFEESLEAWKLTCTAGQVQLGVVTSDKRYEELEKSAVVPKVKEVPQNPKPRRGKRLPQ